MGLLSGDSDENVIVDKFEVGRSMKLIRIVDREAGVVLYTDTTRDGYTSIPLSETDIQIEDNK